MRNRIVHDGAATIFFLTTRKKHEGRVLAGYYKVGWFTEGTQGAINNDYALAAADVRFIDPILAIELPEPLGSICSAPFRTMKPIDAGITLALTEICDAESDRTRNYLDEVARIERFSLARSGYSYPSWGRKTGFSWADAHDYYQSDMELSKVPNSTKTRRWRCREPECGYVIKSGALLKKCPLCKKNATLVPAEEDA
ncbi:hypothetical protein GS531_22505 [Rhodococcus hoagii]|nr:hypothetical protein [Prescottella equi]